MTKPFDPYDPSAIASAEVHAPKFSKWKGSLRIQALPDSAVTIVQIRKNGTTDYRLENVSVSYHPKNKKKWLCHTCVSNWCMHCKRVAAFREKAAA